MSGLCHGLEGVSPLPHARQTPSLPQPLIDDFYEYRDQRIEDIWDSQSEDNRMSKEWIRRQMTSSAYASASRAPNYWNGYVSKVQQELKEEDPHANLDDARAEIARRMEEAGCDAFKDFLSDSEKEDLRKDMGDERGKKHISVVEFLWRYEAYCSMRDPIPRPPKSSIVLRREIVKLTEDGLKLITGRKDVKMFYKHYDYGIRYLLGVELVGLLDDAKAPINPTKITTLARLQSTVDALVTSKMHWRKMTAAERSKHAAAMDEAGGGRLRDPKKSRGAHPAKSKETVDLSEDEGEEDVRRKGEDAVSNAGEDDDGEQEEEDEDEEDEEDEEEEDEEEEEEEEEDDDESAAATKKTSAAAAKKTAGPKSAKPVPDRPDQSPSAKPLPHGARPKTKGVPKPKRATPKAKRATSKAKRAAPKATAGPPPPRPKPRPLVKTPAIEAEKENTAPKMNDLMGVFDASTGETQLGKRKRPAEDEGGGRELVDGAADDVLTTRRGRRTESSEAREKREAMMAQLAHHSLLPPSMSSRATFCDVPIAARFDGHAATSSPPGVLILPSNAGVISMLLNNVPVTASLGSDLLLGLDWYNFVISLAPQLVVYLDSDVSLDLRRPILSSGSRLLSSSATLAVAPVPPTEHELGCSIFPPISDRGWSWCGICPLINLSFTRG
ncbi:hypothetical protein C8F04DRAFT_1406595 [Mycena alexandri]|uniref:Uncharacterized protein n=1 Tax=Mycena alexandri TaxID=1745969 RepID=A0AAD6RY75_9AGAR|nr:hypothetical protein C8F04DRAFT_1406595 [Mycena alexandri]